MFRSPVTLDTSYLLIGQQEVDDTTVLLTGTLQFGYIPDPGTTLELGVQMTVMQIDTINPGTFPEYLGTIYSDFQTVQTPDLVTTLTESDRENSYVVYPNPTTDFVTVRSQSYETVNVSDMAGREVMKAIPTDQPIDVTSLQKGVYLINRKHRFIIR